MLSRGSSGPLWAERPGAGNEELAGNFYLQLSAAVKAFA
jgi:hypothetical protein